MAVVEMECVREIPDNVQEKLAQYEELFKDRYTKKDQGYRSACQMDETCVSRVFDKFGLVQGGWTNWEREGGCTTVC